MMKTFLAALLMIAAPAQAKVSDDFNSRLTAIQSELEEGLESLVTISYPCAGENAVRIGYYDSMHCYQTCVRKDKLSIAKSMNRKLTSNGAGSTQFCEDKGYKIFVGNQTFSKSHMTMGKVEI